MSKLNQPLDATEIKELHDNLSQQPGNELLSNIITQNGINQAAQDPKAATRLDPVFSIDLDTGKVSNQKRSGRCWLFSLLNTLRHQFAKAYHVKDFEFSQKYLFFWDKIERTNIYYDNILATAHKPANDREVEFYMSMPGEDGGQWAMAAGLVQKYGVMPASVYPETINSEDTSAYDAVMNRKLRKDGMQLRQLINTAADDQTITDTRKRMLKEVYQITAYSFGEPPMKFDLEYRDDDHNYHLDQGLTPQEFYTKYVNVDLDNYVVLSNSPDKEYNQVYTLPSQDNIVGGKKIEFLNLPMKDLKQAAIQTLQNGETLWFGNDVLQQMSRKQGYLDANLYHYSQLFNVDLSMSKADRLTYHEAEVSHAMTLTGVDLVNDQPTKWKVENSWGEKTGEKGYFTMSDDWMDAYVYEVVVKKDYLTKPQLAILDQPKIQLDPWDSLR